ncbi:MAG: hypothetical protein H6709_15230 [Kofleriaceae bacterium]|nr:hypothetical protein [Kofleriaceae bacterium]MCB9573431.1 hypothetical protein [Kofleriaceae bacterium]
MIDEPSRLRRWAPWIAWAVLAAPAIAQLILLAATVGQRFGYPYDLEWMEGGMLQHAQRIADGQGIYGPPSVDFIPYLYTPLYPGALAILGSIFGLSYQLGRAVSIVSMFGIAVVVFSVMTRASRDSGRAVRAAALTGGLIALGTFAATYPWTKGWFDLVRCDTLFLWMVTAGLTMAHHKARLGTGWRGQARTAAAAAVLGLAFFCKQTGILFVGAGGVIVLVTNWRRAPIYVAVTGAIGLGGTALLQVATGRWFWTYVFEVHQAHDFNRDRFWMALWEILGKFPAMTAAIAVGLVAVAATAAVRRELPAAARTFLIWVFVFAVSTVVGMLGFATEFAERNAYMPAMLHGGIAAGVAVPTVIACLQLLLPDRQRRALLAELAGATLTVLMGLQLLGAWWSPRPWVPTEADKLAGDALIAHIAATPGEVWVPAHPWYAHLAGKRMYVHQMGIKDVTWRQHRTILGLDQALRERRFTAVFVDAAQTTPGLPGYRRDDRLAGEAPRTVSGARIRPDAVWVPVGPVVPPPGARVLFDFEDGTFDGWTTEGTAWGKAPVERELPRQGPIPAQGAIYRIGGRFCADSYHGGDAATGTLTSPAWTIQAPQLRLRLGGGGNQQTLRVELVVDGAAVRWVNAPTPSAERLRDVTIDTHDLVGKVARIRVIDAAIGGFGHLLIDEIWEETPATAARTAAP